MLFVDVNPIVSSQHCITENVIISIVGYRKTLYTAELTSENENISKIVGLKNNLTKTYGRCFEDIDLISYKI